jgi:inosose dehydratase
MESLIADPGAVSPVATQTCQLLAAVGGQVLVLIDGLDASRQATAGQSEVAVRLDQDGWDRLLACVETIADIAQTCDLRVAFHPHAGTHVEFQDEIERLMADSRVGLCVDTGHAVYSGIDPISLIRQYSERIEHIHLKDLDASQLIDGLEAGRGFVASVAAGVFTPLGQGSIDLASIALAVRRAGYEGWATYEQDRTLATLDRALADSRSSLGYARSVGF